MPAALHLSDLAPGNIQSEIRAMTVACAAVGGINMAQGVCDTDVPHPVAAAALQAIQAGQNTYTRLDGIEQLRQGIAQKLAAFNHLHVDPDTQVLVTSGATGAMHAALMALLNPGDECVVFEPFYGYHVSTLLAQRISPVIVPLSGPDWALDPDRLRAAVTPRTRALLLNTPANPSGKVFTLAELEQLAALALEHDLFVLTDEMYEYFVYDGQQHRSIATLPGMAERTITISGLSKTFSVTGWRLGYLADATHVPGTDAKAKARTLLAATGIAAVAGSAFFQTDAVGHNPGDNLLRFCFAKKEGELTQACQRLDAYRLLS